MNPVALAVDDCRALTARMLEAADRGDWETVAALDARRRSRFDGVDVAALQPDTLEALLGEFRALMVMDGRLLDRAAGARQAALRELRSVRGRQHVGARYRELVARG